MNVHLGDREASPYNRPRQIGGLGWPATVSGGGTPSVQKNIIAERMLGLPED